MSLSHARKSSSASRSGVLTPASDNLLHGDRDGQVRGAPGSSELGKRKRESISNSEPPLAKKLRPALAPLPPSADDLLKSTIVLKPHPSDLRVKPRILHPLMLLPRESLPLSALDLHNPHGDFPSSRLYESRIKILELEGRLGSNVLLARSEIDRIVYAIERERAGLFVLCKLGAWVDVEKLSLHATVVSSRRLTFPRPVEPPSSATFSPPVITIQQRHVQKKRRLAMDELQAVVKKRSRSQSVVSQVPTPQNTDSITHPPSDEVVSLPKPSVVASLLESPLVRPEGDPMETQPVPPASQEHTTAEDIFQNIRAQYFEALYHSMGSLAYFAKGPLSRARAAFHLDCDSNLEMNDLIEFLKSLIITTGVIDKKYRDTVPELLGTFKTLVEDSEKDEAKAKKKKTKKMKLGRDGLYPGEYDHIKRWWASRQPILSANDEKSMTPEETNYHISCIRHRETQLQMILIFEILALEPLNRPHDASESQLPGQETQQLSQEPRTEPTTKKRSKHNFPVLLDVHADRLCIWHSTTLDDVRALAESQLQVQGQAAKKGDEADGLQDFCVDVILPFFSPRLPDICESINRKLGGPVKTAPTKGKPTKPAPPKPKPGAPAKRKPISQQDQGRKLERVLSNERMRRSVSRAPDAFALMKSKSTVLPGLKRETSEPLMAMIPKADGTTVPKPRQVPLFARSISFGSAKGSKADKKAQVEAELQDAISALKRPNRAAAGKEIVDEAEKRLTAGGSQLKKMKKGGSRSSAIQVKATPANYRFRDAVGLGDRNPHPNYPADIDNIPSSISMVPSSGVAQRSTNLFGSATSADRSKIEATPAKAFTISRPLEIPGDKLAIPTSPILARKAAPKPSTRQYLSVPTANPQHQTGGSSSLLLSSPGLPSLFETPLKPRSSMRNARMTLNETPIKPRLPSLVEVTADEPDENTIRKDLTSVPAAPPREQTIYQRLGWDDDDGDELA